MGSISAKMEISRIIRLSCMEQRGTVEVSGLNLRNNSSSLCDAVAVMPIYAHLIFISFLSPSKVD